MTVAQAEVFAETSPANQPSRYRPDQVIAGRYRLVRPLADGGMAELWLAQHADLNSEVVLKFLRDESVAEEQFKLEAQISAQLAQRTKGVVSVIDWGSAAGVPYLVMELVSGATLATEIEKGPMRLSRLIEIFDQLAEALAVAHEQGVIHCDLKPTNIMLGDERGKLVVKIADFGVARAKRTGLLLERPTEPLPTAVTGSPAYASPEQLCGLEVDARSDVWSLGVIAYEALTGARPFGSDVSGAVSPEAVLAAIAARPFPRAHAYNGRRGSITPQLSAWFGRALATDRETRFGSVAEMVSKLHRCARGGDSTRSVIYGLIAALCVLAPILVFLVFSSIKSSPAPQASATAPRETAPPAAPVATTAAPVPAPSPVEAEHTAPPAVETAPAASTGETAPPIVSAAPPPAETTAPIETAPPRPPERPRATESRVPPPHPPAPRPTQRPRPPKVDKNDVL